MLKYILLLLACLTFSAGFKVNLTRNSFYLNVNKEENTFFKGVDIKENKIIMDTSDIRVYWTKEYNSWVAKNLPMDFYIYYKTGGYFAQIDRFWPCDNPASGSFKGLATYFFNKIIADFKRDQECPIPSNVNVTSPGHLQFTRSTADGIYCNTVVSVHLLIYENVLDTTEFARYKQNKVFEVAYEGTFTDC